MMRCFVALVVIGICANAERQGILFPDGSILKYEVTVNQEDNTEILTFGATRKPGQLNGIKFHDFNTGYLASKLIDHGVCLVNALTGKKPTYITPTLVKMPPVTNYTIAKKTLSSDELAAFAGEKIAGFCQGYNSHFLIKDMQHNKKREAVQQVQQGKYGQDFGLVEEDCFKYEARDAPCKQTTCQRYYTRDYYYVGGYYGACNEPLMRAELVKNGPIAISFEVYGDFTSYKSGIYHHTGLEDKFNPWEITNHVVLIVGYGEEMGQPYWIVKNSWGPEWGEDGFFRIRRGTDKCSMESIAVGTFPVV